MLGRLLTVACFGSAWLGSTTLGFAAVQYAIVDLGDLGGSYAQGRAINEQGQVAGYALLPATGTVQRAFLWQAGALGDLGTLGGQQSSALGINSAGTVCGWAQTASGNGLPALWSGSAVIALPTLGGPSGTAWGINDAGTAAGHSYLSAGGYHAALWSGGEIRDLGTLGGPYSVAYDVNNRGVAVGTASDPSGRDRAVLWGQGGPIDLGGLSGGQWSTARGINDLGQVILQGSPQSATENRAAFWNGDPLSPVIDLGTLAGGESWAWGLNDFGFVVGWEEVAVNANYHAFVWDGVEKTDLGTLGGFYSSAYGINDQGIIVGYAMDAFARTHAVEWVPVPEPAALLLGLLGGGMFSLWTRCRRQNQRSGCQISRCERGHHALPL